MHRWSENLQLHWARFSSVFTMLSSVHYPYSPGGYYYYFFNLLPLPYIRCQTIAGRYVAQIDMIGNSISTSQDVACCHCADSVLRRSSSLVRVGEHQTLQVRPEIFYCTRSGVHICINMGCIILDCLSNVIDELLLHITLLTNCIAHVFFQNHAYQWHRCDQHGYCRCPRSGDCFGCVDCFRLLSHFKSDWITALLRLNRRCILQFGAASTSVHVQRSWLHILCLVVRDQPEAQ